ncbi:MAG: efflux RND transporter periplasmic adaptor subunit [Comamonadaceae bacterium]|nr:efflux RND transporter periplasmic adaptor subunit [Comamonadaceae bacterium]
MKKTYLIAGAVALALAGGGAWWWTQRDNASDVQYRTGKIERGSLLAAGSASGAVNPVTQVSVGTQVSGQIKELYVDFNSLVKAGQLIAVIDPETFEYRVRSAQADVDAARAAVMTAQANALASRASISRAQVDVNEAQRDFDRKQSLVEKQFIAQSEADKARALVNTTTESLKLAQAQAGVTEAQIKTAQANVAQREAALAQARVDLQRTRITSPVDGIVIKRAIEKGQTVAASLQSPELFVIAQNLSDMQVDASIDESDVGRIRTGQKATFTVDAFPGQTFEGEVRQVRKAAQNVANVVTYVAVVGFSNVGDRLVPGMTANVRIVTESRENVLKVPNAALRVRIAGVEPAQGAASGASAPASTSTGSAGGWTWFSQAVAQPAGGGGGFAALRERLVSELQLDADQQARLDAISAELRPKFMALRDLPEEERAAAREKVSAEMRSKITAMLTPTQRTKYQALQAQAASSGARPAASAAPGGPSTATKPIAGSDQSALGSGKKDAKNAPVAAANAAAGAGSAPLTSSSAPAAPMAAAPAPGATAASPGAGAAPPAPAAPGAPGANAATEFRNRLVAELALTPAQVEKVDAIYAESRPKFATLRDLPAEERPKARDRIMADIRARIGDVLTPEQKPKYAALVAQAASRQATRGRIYLLGEDGKPVAYNVRLGITDGTSTELIVPAGSPEAPVLKEGAVVITGTVTPGSAPPKPATTGPRMPF